MAAQTGFSPSALRFYEGAGLVEPGRTSAGYRVYDDRAVARLRFIGRAKDLGLSLDEVAELLPAWEGDECGEVAGPLAIRVAEKVRETRTRIAELTVLAAELEAAGHRLTHEVANGPCGPSCACTPAPAPLDDRVVVALGSKPASSLATGSVPIACTLTPGEAVDRVGDWERLLAQRSGAPVRRVDGDIGSVAVRFAPDPHVASAAAELAAAEQACCAFIDFTLRIDRSGTELTATTALDAMPIVDAILGASS